MAIDLKANPTSIKTYDQYHADPFPEVVEALHEVGVINMRIWRWQTRLFMLLEVPDDFDVPQDMPRYLDHHPRCQEWEDLMGTLQEVLPGVAPGQKWASMDQIFDLETQRKNLQLHNS